MTANDLLQWLSWVLYLLIFVLVGVTAIRRPTRAHLDMVLFFGDTTAIILLSTLGTSVWLVPVVWLSDVAAALLLALPYLLLRLVSDFSRVRAVWTRATEAGLVLSIVTVVLLPTPMPTLPALLLVAYFLIVTAYDAWAFIRQARATSGVTRRRMQSIAIGTVCLGLVLLIAGASAAGPDRADLWMALSQAAGVASGVAYFAGFAPPTLLRRAWQEPELRASLNRMATLPHLPDTRSIVKALENSAAASLGASGASLGLWDGAVGKLRFFYKPPPVAPGDAALPSSALPREGDVWEVEPQTRSIYAGAFVEQRATFIADVERADPANAVLARAYGARSALAAPITAGPKRLGVLVVYAPQEPVFADSDLELLQLLCDQAAVILESRALLDEATRLQAREQALRLKTDFLSSAAHQVKTPLTGVLTQSQLLLRHASREPVPDVQQAGLQRIVRETQRLSRVLVELFDAAQVESTAPTASERDAVDLAALAREVVLARPRCRVDAPRPVITQVDGARIAQLLEHLIGNALLYDPSHATVLVRVWQDDDRARLSVQDRGIGIPPDDLPHLFERFHRGTNVDDRRFAGLGLGLFISRQIVEEHGGRIWATSTLTGGTTFDVELPLASEAATSHLSGVVEADA